MIISSSVDVLASKKKEKTIERRERGVRLTDQPQPSTSKEIPSLPLTSDTTDSADSSPLQNSTNDSSQDTQEDADRKHNTLSLPSLALVCERTGVSDRAAAMIASSATKDLGIISDEQKLMIIDRSKVRRERKKMRKQSQNKESSSEFVF